MAAHREGKGKMPWMVECDGEFVNMPLEGDWIVPTLEGRFPNSVILDMDEAHFKRGFGAHASGPTAAVSSPA
jgi:hypothetical protein